jgi:hypothetical protein
MHFQLHSKHNSTVEQCIEDNSYLFKINQLCRKIGTFQPLKYKKSQLNCKQDEKQNE